MKQSSVAYLLKDDDFEFTEELDFIFSTFSKRRHPVLIPMVKGWMPLTDVFETDEDVVIIIDIAGISVNDVRLTLRNNVLAIRGIRREQPGGEKRHYHKMEIDFGPFERRIEIPARIDPDRATRRYTQGFLEIRLPKLLSLGADRPDFEIDL